MISSLLTLLQALLSDNNKESKMAPISPSRYIEMRIRRIHLGMRTGGIRAFSNGYGVVVWTGENDTKTISVDENIFENGTKQLRFRLKTD